jgi:Ca-activated chloride channel family protein
MTTAAALIAPTPSHPSSGGRLVAVDGRTLPLTGARLTAEAGAGLARVRLEQRFVNVHAEPLSVTYLFPLPHDGAVSGFAFLLDGRRVVGEVDRVAAARERYEEAMLEGRTAALVEQVRGSVFTQSLGNLPPGAEVVVELAIDQRLAWLPEGAWEWRFPTTVAPRYQGAAGRTPDAGRLTVPVADGGLPVRLALDLAVADGLAPGGAVTSPSHALRSFQAPLGGALRATLAADGGVPLDRDVVVRWPVAGAEVGLSLAAGAAAAGTRLAGRAFGLLTVLPPVTRALRPLPRDLTVLLDTSGSMDGAPLDQARAVVGALVDSLGAEDRLELIEFSSSPRAWKRAPVAATPANRADALRWLARLRAGGSTEMTAALYAALAPLRAGSQRQVVLVTDGEIGFEQEIVAEIMDRLPAGSRLHTVGVGSAVNRSLTAPAARAGRGVEVVIGLGEDPGDAARRLLARTVAPAVTELTLSGPALVRHAPARLPDLFGGAPALLPLELRPEGGALTLRGRAAEGPFERTVVVPPAGGAARAVDAASLAALFAREAVEDLEAQAAAGRGEGVEAGIERLGLDFQIATRLTAWIAVSSEVTVDPTKATRRETMPSELPHGMSAAGLGLRQALSPRLATSLAQFDVEELAADFGPPMGWSSASPSAAGVPPPPPASPAPVRAKKVKGAPRRQDLAEEKEARFEADEGSVGPRALAARLVLAKDRRLVLEATVEDGPLDWSPGDEVTVTLDDGTQVTARVVGAATTAAGHLEEGAVLRLVVDLDAPLPPGSGPREVTVTGGLLTLVVRQAP